MPYLGSFNMVQLCFGKIKKETYSHLFFLNKELKEYILNILMKENFKKDLNLFIRKLWDNI